MTTSGGFNAMALAFVVGTLGVLTCGIWLSIMLARGLVLLFSLAL